MLAFNELDQSIKEHESEVDEDLRNARIKAEREDRVAIAISLSNGHLEHVSDA